MVARKKSKMMKLTQQVVAKQLQRNYQKAERDEDNFTINFIQYLRYQNNKLWSVGQGTDVALVIIGFIITMIGASSGIIYAEGFGLGMLIYGTFKQISIGLFYFPEVKRRLWELNCKYG